MPLTRCCHAFIHADNAQIRLHVRKSSSGLTLDVLIDTHVNQNCAVKRTVRTSFCDEIDHSHWCFLRWETAGRGYAQGRSFGVIFTPPNMVCGNQRETSTETYRIDLFISVTPSGVSSSRYLFLFRIMACHDFFGHMIEDISHCTLAGSAQ